jgi:hypothetical protein
MPGPLTHIRSLGPSHQWGHKSRVSFRGPLCAHGVAGTPHGEIRNTHLHQMEAMSSSTILIVGHTNTQVAILYCRHSSWRGVRRSSTLGSFQPSHQRCHSVGVVVGTAKVFKCITLLILAQMRQLRKTSASM